VREAKEKKYLYIFVILDNKEKESIYNVRSAIKNEKGMVRLTPYLKNFPFEYYCVI